MPHPTSHPATDETLGYYDANADAFVRSTVNVAFSSMRQRFTQHLSPGARILDFGCGSGRDSLALLKAGFNVTATEGSAELCRLARELTGLPVRHELFQDLADECTYNGIWACSSILHLPRPELADVLARMERALLPDGIIYTSFKLGTFEGMRNGRHFTNFTEESFRSFLASVPTLRVKDLWITGDVRPGREDEQWLNLLLKKA